MSVTPSHTVTTPMRRPLLLRRSWLFTSGIDTAAQELALQSRPDALVADLEEFTPAAQRPLARKQLVPFFARCRAAGVLSAVRINRLQDDGADDLRGILPGAPDIVFLPRVESVDDIRALALRLDEAERQMGLVPLAIEIVPTIESALGVVRLQDILHASPRVQSALLASEDLGADLRVERGPDTLELAYLRQRFHVECRAAERLAIDCPYNYRDVNNLRQDLTWMRRVGMQAKCTVFAQHVATIHEALTPSEAAQTRARELVARFEAAQQAKANGEVVDTAQGVPAPDYHTARRLLARAEQFRQFNDLQGQAPKH